MLRIGHRDAAELAPQNTIAATRAAIGAGVDMGCIISTGNLRSLAALNGEARTSATGTPGRWVPWSRLTPADVYLRSGARDATLRHDIVTSAAIERMAALGCDGVITDDPPTVPRGVSMQANRPHEPSYGGIPTFSKLPLVLDPSELAGVDVAVLGAPFDETVSNRPGSRYGPRAIRAADDSAGVPPSRPHMWLGVDPFAELRVVDYGDAETVPGNPAESHAQVRRRVSEICAAGAIPIVLGGDHSVAHPNMAAVAEHRGKGAVGVIHFDAHADTAADLRGVVRSHGTPMRLVVDEGWVRGDRFIQVGLRGWWPDPEEFAWMRRVGFHWYTMYELDERGFDVCLSEVIRSAAGWGQPVFLSIDVDALDPAYAPGTGTPEVGGLTMRELLRAARRITAELPIAGVEVVEVAPAYDPSGITAVNAHRLVLEILSGLALARSGRDPQPEHDGRPHV